MKKIWIILLILCIAVSNCAALDGEITVYVDAQQVAFDTPPFVENDRVMVPIRAISESLGATVTWVSKSNMILIETAGSVLVLSIGSDIMYKDTEPILLSAAPMIKNDRTYVPLRAVSEAFYCTVNWDEAAAQVTIDVADNFTDGDVSIQNMHAAGEVEKENGEVFSYDVTYLQFLEDDPLSWLNTAFAARADEDYLTALSHDLHDYRSSFYVTYNKDNIFSVVVIETKGSAVVKTGYTVDAKNGRVLSLFDVWDCTEEETDAFLRAEIKTYCQNVLNLADEEVDKIDTATFYYTFYVTDDEIVVLVPLSYFTEDETADIEFIFDK